MLGIAEENSSSWEEGLEGGLVWEHRAEGGGWLEDRTGTDAGRWGESSGGWWEFFFERFSAQ